NLASPLSPSPMLGPAEPTAPIPIHSQTQQLNQVTASEDAFAQLLSSVSAIQPTSPATPSQRSNVRTSALSQSLASQSSISFRSPKITASSPKSLDPADPLRLHLHIDSYVRRSLGVEPERYTEDFTEWVGYDPSLTGLALAERRDEWLRKAGGGRGRSISRTYHDWEAAYQFLVAELKRDLCKLWAMLGRLYPFSKAENAEWKQAKKARKEQEQELLNASKVKGKGKEKMYHVSGDGLESSHSTLSIDINRAKAISNDDDDDWPKSKTPTKARHCSRHRSGSPEFHESFRDSSYTTPEKYLSSAPSLRFNESSSSSPTIRRAQSSQFTKRFNGGSNQHNGASEVTLTSNVDDQSTEPTDFTRCDSKAHDDEDDDIFGMDALDEEFGLFTTNRFAATIPSALPSRHSSSSSSDAGETVVSLSNVTVDGLYNIL
ncbi:hypothetical protein HDV05_002217, partial [Chytridiales sp. JEL 0842]